MPVARRLKKRGKPHKLVVVAIARRLITIANAILKAGETWRQLSVRSTQLLNVDLTFADDRKAIAFQRHKRMMAVGQQRHLVHAQLRQNLRAEPIVA